MDCTAEPNTKFVYGELLGCPKGTGAWFVSSAMVSSTLIWSLFCDAEVKPPDVLRISKTGVVVAADIVALDEVNEKTGADEEPKPNEETPGGEDLSPKENPVDGEEPNR